MSGLAEARFSSKTADNGRLSTAVIVLISFKSLVVLEGSAGGRLASGHHARHTKQHHSIGKISRTPPPWTGCVAKRVGRSEERKLL
jgi:hypothetical protein